MIDWIKTVRGGRDRRRRLHDHGRLVEPRLPRSLFSPELAPLHPRIDGAHPMHASPAEHQATPNRQQPHLHGNFRRWVQYHKASEQAEHAADHDLLITNVQVDGLDPSYTGTTAMAIVPLPLTPGAEARALLHHLLEHGDIVGGDTAGRTIIQLVAGNEALEGPVATCP